MNIKHVLASSPMRIAVASVVAAVLLAGGLQMAPGCRQWRDWKSSKEGQRYVTMELFSKPAYCFDL